ncbi:uncharacterized protein LOC133319972 [Danaus plexippus]|uniref:Uncharacterized protein n=1 Tax=Danaus plexippus plexippus TaxID=278856 RepID=A0A212ENY4_DANPL|nr:uncharacterized protein LOC133319972 [Danaus plexippus]OWR43212.1 hypothetical protein KGM_203948 [Danaus plexippus plexippus]
MSFHLVTKKRVLVIFLIFVFIISLVYLNLNYIQQNYENARWSSERCFNELTSIKYQLNVVTEYKNRIDKLLTETQKKYETDKEHFQDIIENCVAMKQQSVLCQSQFEDLQSECKKTKEAYDTLKKESGNIKPGR